ncbi:MAG: hypothetical protein WA821_20870 [Anaerolineales bacterium]
MKVVKVVVTVFGVLAILMGAVWFLQGINVLPGSFMTGQLKWAINGGIAILVGVVLIAAANWKRIRGK